MVLRLFLQASTLLGERRDCRTRFHDSFGRSGKPMSKWATLHRINGLHVGLLNDEELAIFNEACRRHEAKRSYEGAGGLAKVRVTAPPLSSQTRGTEA